MKTINKGLIVKSTNTFIGWMGKYVERLQRIYGSDETSYDVYNTRSAVSLVKVGMVCTKKPLDEKNCQTGQ